MLYMGLITFLSHLPGTGESGALLFFGFEFQVHYGNLLHVPLYWGLAVFWHVACETVSMPASRRALVVIGLTAAFGVVDEVHQSFVPGRTPSGIDVVSDAIGAVLAALSWRFLRPLFFAAIPGPVSAPPAGSPPPAHSPSNSGSSPRN